MRFTQLFACGATLYASAAASNRDDFKDWAAKFEKKYESIEEELRRFQVWTENRAMIEAHNTEEAKGLHSFRMELNHLGDMSDKEYRLTMLGLRSSTRRATTEPASQASSDAAPDSYDWRPQGIVTDVKNQAQCGSCWAFSAVAAMEGAYNLASKGKVSSDCKTTCGPQKTPCCSFSEQELVDCTHGGTYTCNTGGIPSDGIDEIAKNQTGTFRTEAEYPYTSAGGTSTGVCQAKGQEGVATGISGFSPVTSGDEDALKTATYQQSIISIAIDASQQSFQFYSSGVYVEPQCSSQQLDHGVSVVGYGSTSSSNSVTSGGDYWIVRNSWGPGWGMDGYILMARNKNNQCGVATEAVYANVGSAGSALIV